VSAGTTDERIELLASALVVLIGAAGSGKSAFAASHLPPDAVLASDQLRARLGRSEADQDVNDAVFEQLQGGVADRLGSGLLTVVDATNTDWMRRSELIRMARQHGRPAVAIVFDLPLEVCLARNRARVRTVPASVIRQQVDQVQRDRERLDLEGFTSVWVLNSADQVDRVRVEIEGDPVTRVSP
jgi:predicted kinase